jgi:hypothetical protein
MTDNDIIKVLNYCANVKDYEDCRKCPIKNTCDNHSEKLVVVVADLVNRQKAEIERLNLENSQMIASIKGLKKLYETYPDDEEASALYLIRQINEIVKKMKGNNDE